MSDGMIPARFDHVIPRATFYGPECVDGGFRPVVRVIGRADGGSGPVGRSTPFRYEIRGHTRVAPSSAVAAGCVVLGERWWR